MASNCTLQTCTSCTDCIIRQKSCSGAVMESRINKISRYFWDFHRRHGACWQWTNEWHQQRAAATNTYFATKAGVDSEGVQSYGHTRPLAMPHVNSWRGEGQSPCSCRALDPMGQMVLLLLAPSFYLLLISVKSRRVEILKESSACTDQLVNSELAMSVQQSKWGAGTPPTPFLDPLLEKVAMVMASWQSCFLEKFMPLWTIQSLKCCPPLPSMWLHSNSPVASG